MLVSHEIPISIFEESKKFNDYDYCLLHLTAIPEYRDFYINSIKEGRKVLLDNSLFELGDALTVEDVRKGVLDINPTWVVVPDCLNDADTTIKRFKEWEKECSDLDVLTIGVAQGNTLEEITRCYIFMSKHADKIAIPFDSEAFNELVTHYNKLDVWCNGRQAFVQYLVDEGIWNNDKPHHLLGCSYAREFANPLYRQISIETIDTSNPVVAGLLGFKYEEDGLNYKPSIKLCDLINAEVREGQLATIKYNTSQFKKICGYNKWVAFFSQTGGEILEVSKQLGRYPDIIITNKIDFSNVVEGFPLERIISIPNKPTLEEYMTALGVVDLDSALITLHGYLRIIPPELCKYNILNLHPGLITKYPFLKGFNPQEKAFRMHLKESGVIIHNVTSELDSGAIIKEVEVPIEGLTLDETYQVLHDCATDAWVEVLKELL